MKRSFALACAVSAVAIVPHVNAQSLIAGSHGDQFSVTIQGSVPGFCTIGSSTSLTVSNGSYVDGSASKTGTIQFTNLGDTSGKVQSVSATGSFTITANETCHLSLVSANGGLKNNTYTTAAKIAYKAVVYDDKATNKTVVDVAAPGAAFSEFNSSFDPVALSSGPIKFDFKIDQGTGVVAAGNYEDTLTLKLDPTI